LMTLVPSPLSFTKKLVCSFDEDESEPEILDDALAEFDGEVLFAVPHPVRTASTRAEERASPALKLENFMVSS
jgi:hypothetical protein